MTEKEKELESQGLAKSIVRNKGNKLAAMKDFFGEGAFDNDRSAISWMTSRMKSRELRKDISDLLDKQGLSLPKANSKLKELLEAKKGVVVNNQLEYVPDNACQTANLHKLYDLHQAIPRTPPAVFGIDIDNRSIQLNLDDERLNRLKTIADELKELNQQLQMDTTAPSPNADSRQQS